MKKIRNKFIIFVFLLIALIVFVWIYNSFFNGVDRNTYAILIDWKWTINDELMIKESKELLEIWDIVKTIWADSLIVVEWWDWSVTRLWANSSVKIKELFVDDDLLQINLSFELLSWKSWSNVLNFMWSKSYFKESFRDIEAWVRWTVFNVDLDNEYISVLKHKVTLVGENINDTVINENEPFSLETFSVIKLIEFIKNVKDKDFADLNVTLDVELLDWLKDKIHENLDKFADLAIENFEKLPLDEKEKLYNDLLSKYQELNFIESVDEELFAKKMEYKEALINLAWESEKINLIENTLYDLKDSIKSKEYWNLDTILPILFNNKDLLDKVDVNFQEYFENIQINDSLKEAFWRNLSYFKDIFWTDFSAKFPDVSFEWIKDQTKELYNNSWVKDKLDEQVGFIKKFFQFLFNK